MDQDEALDAAAKRERVRTLLRQQFEAGTARPFPIDIFRGYDFPLFTPEQLPLIASPEWCRPRPTQTLDEYLSRRGCP